MLVVRAVFVVLLLDAKFDILFLILTLVFRIVSILSELKTIMQKKMIPWDEFTTRNTITSISIPK